MSSSVKDEIKGWIQERLDDVEQEGQLAIVGLVHYDGHGRDQELFSMKAGTGKWKDADAMAESFYGYAARHARGLVGAQQFNLNAVYGSSGKATRFLPFGLAGMLQIGSMANGGLSTEPATETGMRQQGMRMGEMVVSGMIAQINPTFRVQADLIDRLMRNNVELSHENRELFIALRTELERGVQLAHERRIKEMEFMRSTDERRRLIKIMPAFVNAMTGREIFPTTTEDSALIETLCENVSEDEIKMFAAVLGEKSPELAGLMMNRFATIQKKKIEEADALRALAKEATGGGSYDAAERDAAGEPVKGMNGSGGAAAKQIAAGG